MSNRYSLRSVYVAIFLLSGFSGLIYESIWSHYLKLFLGHAAYAQTLVLIIFMGGMASGSYLASRFSGRFRNLLLVYGLTEGVVGLIAINFHDLFLLVTGFGFSTLIPAIDSPQLVEGVKWSLGALLILPQSVLLGATFPLMSAGIIRKYPDNSGNTIATLYFANSLGAAIGVLFNGFYLIENVGLPGATLTAGLINIGLAIIVWALSKNDDIAARTPSTRAPLAVPLFLLTVAAGTGAASFMYEIAWIRMLSMVLGSSSHSFELMLSAFILGLAIGGLWIRSRIDRLRDPQEFLGRVQVVMGGLAILTVVFYGELFNLMAMLMAGLARTDPGYSLFNLYSYALSLSIMLPATICAGMTLPLVTHILLRRTQSESAIGQVYAGNTLGSIAGVVVAVHLIMPVFGLKSLVMTGGVLDIALGTALFLNGRVFRLGANKLAVFGSLAVAVVVALFFRLDALKMASGVFRVGKLLAPETTEVKFQRDGKTATASVIDLLDNGGEMLMRFIATNGKPDASISSTKPPSAEKPPSRDESTMVLAAALPLAINPDIESIANIGIGSGLTAHVALSDPTVKRVDTIEIEPFMVEGARQFGERVENTFNDSRSRIHYADAKTFFSNRKTKYDLIISEPSNPWVSGVSSLFTREFYRHVADYLNEDGLFAQWIQIYEISPRLIASIYKSLSETFGAIQLYQVGDTDILFVAKREGHLPDPSNTLFQYPAMSRELKHIGVESEMDLLARRIAGTGVLERLFFSYEIPANSDYFPVLDVWAPRSRFLSENAFPLLKFKGFPLELEDTETDRPKGQRLSESGAFGYATMFNRAQQFYSRYQTLADGGEEVAIPGDGEKGDGEKAAGETDAESLYQIHYYCAHSGEVPSFWPENLASLLARYLPYLNRVQISFIARSLADSRCFAQLPESNQKLLLALYHTANGDYSQARSQLADFMKEPTFSYEGMLMAKMGLVALMEMGESERAKDVALQYLRRYPNDIQFRYLFARATKQ